MSPLPILEHAWVVEAMVASYNHVYKVVYNTQYHEQKAIAISDYGSAPIASFQVEFLAMDENPKKVMAAIRKYKVGDRKYVLDVFHGQPSAREVKAQYAGLDLEFVRTGPILGLDLPTAMLGHVARVKKVETREQLEAANAQLSAEGETIPVETLTDPNVHNFVAEWKDRVAGWAQLVTVYPEVGYVNQLYTMRDLRNNRIGTSVMTYVHGYCADRGLKRTALVSSDMALGVYRRFGYRPLAYFTVFRPKTKDPQNA